MIMTIWRILLFSLLLSSCTPVEEESSTYSEQHAFCVDRSYSMYRTSYENTKAYNSCMKNADSLIQKYERDKLDEKAALREWRIRIRKEKKMKQQKLESTMNDAFGEPQ